MRASIGNERATSTSADPSSSNLSMLDRRTSLKILLIIAVLSYSTSVMCLKGVVFGLYEL